MSPVLDRILPTDPASRAAALSVFLNAVLMVVKLTAGVVSGSVAVLSDGLDSLEDVIAAGIALASVRYGARPPDDRHPYGHGRAETIAAGFQATLIGAGGVFIIISSVRRMVDPPDDIGAGLAIAVMVVAGLANLTLVQYTGRVAKQTGSPAIASEARHLWTNVVQAGAVIAGLVAVAVTGDVRFDGAVAFVLGYYLLWIAGNIILTSLREVLDTSLDRVEVARIEEAIMIEGHRVQGYHLLRTRKAGQVRHVDFHLVVPGQMTVEESHAMIDRIEARIEAAWPGTVVTVHAEPAHGAEHHPGL